MLWENEKFLGREGFKNLPAEKGRDAGVGPWDAEVDGPAGIFF